jgi:hypothetical protein
MAIQYFFSFLSSSFWYLVACSVFILYTVGESLWTEDQAVASPLPTYKVK